MTAKNILFLTGMLLSLLLGSRAGWTETVEVKIIKSTFIPVIIKVKPGDTIRWVNTEELLHTVTSGKAPVPDKKFNASYVIEGVSSNSRPSRFLRLLLRPAPSQHARRGHR